MNFINPYTTIYFDSVELRMLTNIPFYKEIIWLFLKHLDNRLKLFRHRVNIHFTNTDQTIKTRQFGSIYDYYTKVDKEAFKTLDDLSRRKLLLNIIYQAFKELAECYDWDRSVIDLAYVSSLNEDLHFNFETASKKNRKKFYTASIQFTLVGNTLVFYSLITNTETKEIKKVKLLETNEDYFSWEKRFKEYGWYDNERFGLKLLSGELWIVAHCITGEIQEIIRPNKKTSKEIHNLLARLKEPPFSIKS